MSLNGKIKSFVKIMLLPFVAGFLLSVNFIKTDIDTEISLISVFCGCIFQNPLNIGKLVKAFSPVILFAVLFGSYIYSDLTKSGIYLVVRYKNRVMFLIKKFLKLFACAVIYSVFFILAVVISISPEKLDKSCICIIAVAFYNLVMTCIMLSLFINLISFFLGETNGFTAGISVFAFLCIESLINKVTSFRKFSVYKLNPIRNYIINWHDWELLKGNQMWEMGAVKDFTIRFSVGYFLFVVAILIAVLMFTVIRYDIAVSVKEEM